MNVIKYKDYEGTAELDMESMVCRGKILFIDDLVTYEALNPAQLQKEFEAAIEDYIETCALVGKEPQKPLRGQFNVRISPELHKAATLKAIATGSSLNDVVVKALDCYLNPGAEVNHNHNVKVELLLPEGNLTRVIAGDTPPIWRTVANATTTH